MLMEKRDFTLQGAKQIESLSKSTDLDLRDENWGSFTKSLKNAIIKQNTILQLEAIQKPIDIVYGSFDLLLISKYYGLLAKSNANITVTSVAATHTINKRYAKTIYTILKSLISSK